MEGEIVFAMAGTDAILSVMNFAMLIGVSKWVATLKEAGALLPEYSDLGRRMGRWIKWAV